MTRRVALVLATVIAALAFASAAAARAQDTPPAPTTPAPSPPTPAPSTRESETPPADAPQKVTLAVAVAKGARFVAEARLVAHRVVKSPRGESVSTMSVVQNYDGDVAAVDAAGTATLRLKTARVRLSTNDPNAGDVSVDSSDVEEAAAPETPAAQARQAMRAQIATRIGQSREIRVGADGVPKDAGPAGAFGTSGESSQPAGCFPGYPDRAIGPGDTWSSEFADSFQGIPLKVLLKSTVKAVDADTVTITREGTVELSGGPVSAAITGSKVTGTVEVSRKDGLARRQDVVQEFTISMAPPAAPGEPAPKPVAEIAVRMELHFERAPAPPTAAEPPAAPAK